MSDELTLEELSAKDAAKVIEEQQEQIRYLQGALHQTHADRDYDVPVQLDRNMLRFGLWSDPHFGSRYCRADALAKYYDLLRAEGITFALCAGDILDGHGIYRGQEFEQSHIGLARQLEALHDQAPNGSGIVTYFVSGNHDYSFFRSNGVEPWHNIAEITGWTHVGIDSGTVRLRCKGGRDVRVGLMHPDGGTAYALSYRPQRLIEAIPGGQKPDILGIGHYHKAEYMPRWRNIAAFQAGAFQSQTPFLKRKGSDSHVGGWIVEVVMSDRESLTASVGARFISYYEPEK